MDKNDKITFTYFAGNGKGFFARCMLDVSKTPYTNKVVTYEEWEKMDKPINTYEYGFLPVLEVNGKAYSQAKAIDIFLAQKLGFLGSNAEEEYEINNILNTQEDFIIPIIKFFTSAPNLSKEETEKQLKNINEELLPWILAVLERKFVNRKGKYYVGDKVSLADIYMAAVHCVLFSKHCNKMFEAACLKHAPKFFEFAANLITKEFKDYFVNGNFNKESPY